MCRLIGKTAFLINIFFLFFVHNAVCSSIFVEPDELFMKIHEIAEIKLNVRNLNETTPIDFTVQHNDILQLLFNYSINLTNTGTYQVLGLKVLSTNLGKTKLSVNSSNPNLRLHNKNIKIEVYNSHLIDVISMVVGWTYFVAWSISFYPQIHINYTRRSVTGLNFDFLAFNIVGFTCDNIFNWGLFFVPYLQDEYFHRYTRGLIPVLVNDIFFSVHAFVATVFTIMQCCLYERGSQRVSTTARCLLTIFAGFILFSVLLSFMDKIHWLDFIYCCSYVKLIITLVKYVPQAYMNYQRKNTIGWSIGNIFLDCFGGLLCMMQMMLKAYNYDDWVSLIGNPTKFGLGIFTIFFDIFFMFQHYVLYPHRNETPSKEKEANQQKW